MLKIKVSIAEETKPLDAVLLGHGFGCFSDQIISITAKREKSAVIVEIAPEPKRAQAFSAWAIGSSATG